MLFEIKNGDAVMEFALSHFSYLDTFHDSHYRFMLDNHSLNLEDCVGKTDMKLTRIGTVYFQLDMNMTIDDLNEHHQLFNGWRDTDEEHKKKVLMARFTPNFDQEEWKYDALDTLGVEFNWRE